MSQEPGEDVSPAVSAALRRGFKLKLASDDAPLVILLGWYGCKDRYLSKYGKLVTELGYSQLRAILPIEHIWWPWDGGRWKFARMLLDLLLDTGLCPQRNIVFYSFSNGGAFVVEEIYKLFKVNAKYQPVQRAVQGLVFDSAPSYMHATALHFSSVLAVRDSYPKWLYPGIWLFTWVLIGLVLLMSGLLDGFRPPRRTQYWNFMTSIDFKAPQLYLYSTGDPLCDSAKLEQLIAGRKARGDVVSSTCWDESEHVGHYKRFPAQYTAAVSQFLNKVAGTPARGGGGRTETSER